MKKVLVLVLALALLCSSALAAEIGFLPPAMTSPFYASCIEGATPVAEANGYDLLVMSPPTEDDYATQMSMMEDMITRGVAGIAVCGINLDALIPGIQKANEAGIPVVMFNTITELEGAEVYAYSGYNQYGGGAKIADWVNEQTGGEAKVAIIEGLPSDFTTQRMGGFVDRAAEAYPGIEVVATQPGDWVRETGMNAAMDMLQAHPEINVIYGPVSYTHLDVYKRQGLGDALLAVVVAHICAHKIRAEERAQRVDAAHEAHLRAAREQKRAQPLPEQPTLVFPAGMRAEVLALKEHVP